MAAATVGWWYLSQEADTPVEPESRGRLSFAEVVRRDLVEVETYDGTLGRSDGDAIVNRATGTLTSVGLPGCDGDARARSCTVSTITRWSC